MSKRRKDLTEKEFKAIRYLIDIKIPTKKIAQATERGIATVHAVNKVATWEKFVACKKAYAERVSGRENRIGKKVQGLTAVEYIATQVTVINKALENIRKRL